MTKSNPEREERRQQQAVIADRLKASGALDEIFTKIDAGEALTGDQGHGDHAGGELDLHLRGGWVAHVQDGGGGDDLVRLG